MRSGEILRRKVGCLKYIELIFAGRNRLTPPTPFTPPIPLNSMHGRFLPHRELWLPCRARRWRGHRRPPALRRMLRTASPPHADVVVVNTCSVTAEADRAARAFIRRAHRLNPEARIVATGCYAQRAPRNWPRSPAWPPWWATATRPLRRRLRSAWRQQRPQGTTSAPQHSIHEIDPAFRRRNAAPAATAAPVSADDRFAHSFLEEAQLAPGAQTRPNLKIQEGCGNRCSFCVIPQTRGSSRSLPAAAVLRQVEGFVAAGGNELVLSGINLGRWGRDLELVNRAANLCGAGANDSRAD